MKISDKGMITYSKINGFSKKYNGGKYTKAVSNAVSKSGINAVAFNNEVLAKMKYRFSLELETMTVTNQKQSGRCWLFAGLNVLREKIAKKLNIEYFELSQNYMAFWDKFEKANFFLESVIETLSETADSRIVTWLMQNTVGDGGQWDMFVNLFEKYHAVPKDAMPETFSSSQTGAMNNLLSLKLRENAVKLRSMHEHGLTVNQIRAVKEEMMDEIYTLLCIFFGEPPKSFDFEYNDKDKKYFIDKGLTPKDFAQKYIDTDLKEYVSVINATTADKPFNRAFTVKFLGNVIEGRKVTYLNTDIDTLKKLAVAQMKDTEPVWFGCDVGKMTDRESGIMDAGLYRYDLALDMPFGMTKAQRLDYRDSSMNHAMVFTGVNLEDDVPNRWKVQNSWGDTHGEKGYFVMSGSWFDEYVYQIVINMKYLTDDLKKALEKDVIELAPWDPMGSLADMS
jgi:bleomycin hydrolase